MVALDVLLQMLGDVVHGRTGQQALLAALGNRRRIGTSPVCADAVRAEKRLILQHLAEEPLGCIEITVGCAQEVDRSAVKTLRQAHSKHVPRYLAEFEYRFNRQYDLAAMIPRLCWASVRTTPMPYRLLKLAEVHA